MLGLLQFTVQDERKGDFENIFQTISKNIFHRKMNRTFLHIRLC